MPTGFVASSLCSTNKPLNMGKHVRNAVETLPAFDPDTCGIFENRIRNKSELT